MTTDNGSSSSVLPKFLFKKLSAFTFQALCDLYRRSSIAESVDLTGFGKFILSKSGLILYVFAEFLWFVLTIFLLLMQRRRANLILIRMFQLSMPFLASLCAAFKVSIFAVPSLLVVLLLATFVDFASVIVTPLCRWYKTFSFHRWRSRQ